MICADFVRGFLHCEMIGMTAGIDDSLSDVESHGTRVLQSGLQGDAIRTGADIGDVSGDVESHAMRSVAWDGGQGEIDHVSISTCEIRAPDDGRHRQPARSEMAAQRILGHCTIEPRPRRIERAQAVDQRLRVRANRRCDRSLRLIGTYRSKLARTAGAARLSCMILALAQRDVSAAGHLQWIVIAPRAWGTAVLQERTRRDLDMANIEITRDSLGHAPPPPPK